MNDTSRQILSTNKSTSPQVAKFCRLTSRFCKILSIKTLFKQKQGIKYTLFKLPKSLNNGLNRSFLYEFSLLSRTFPDSPKIISIKIPGFPEILEFHAISAFICSVRPLSSSMMSAYLKKIRDAKLKTIKYPNGTRTHSGIK